VIALQARFAVRLLGDLQRLGRVCEQVITPLIILGLAALIVLTNCSHRLVFEAFKDDGGFGFRATRPSLHG
jgi:hypothetical protein